MKEVLCFFLLIALPLVGLGQKLGNGKELDKDSSLYYITVGVLDDTEVKGGVQIRYIVFVDYGQDNSDNKSNMQDYEKSRNQIPGPDGGFRIFHSQMEVFNFFAGYGWEYVELWPKMKYDLGIDRYLFKRK